MRHSHNMRLFGSKLDHKGNEHRKFLQNETFALKLPQKEYHILANSSSFNIFQIKCPIDTRESVLVCIEVRLSFLLSVDSSGTKPTRKPAEHFPINLTPQNGHIQQETTGSQRAPSNTNSLGSTTSSSTNSSQFDNQTSPRQQAKRTRIPSHESNGVLIPGGGVVVADPVKQTAPPSVIQHLHTTSPHLISTSQASQTNHNVIRNTVRVQLFC